MNWKHGQPLVYVNCSAMVVNPFFTGLIPVKNNIYHFDGMGAYNKEDGIYIQEEHGRNAYGLRWKYNIEEFRPLSSIKISEEVKSSLSKLTTIEKSDVKETEKIEI